MNDFFYRCRAAWDGIEGIEWNVFESSLMELEALEWIGIELKGMG